MIHSFVFSEGKLAAQNLDLDALKLVRFDKGLIIWVDLDHPTDEETKQVLGELFQFHPLAIEDCVAVSSLPKLEDYDDYSFMVMHAVDFSKMDKFTTTELDLFLGKDFLVTYHTEDLRSVRAAIERCHNRQGAQIARGPDRLAHTLLDLMVDNYQPMISELGRELDEIEDILLGDEDEKEMSTKQVMHQLLEYRKDLSRLRQIVRPQREMVHRLARGENKLIRPVMLPYFRDLHDNFNQIEQTASSYNEHLLVSFDVYLNRTGQQTNEGIKILTALTAITLPPVLVGSWYGMNFAFMPELGGKYSYWIALGVTILGMVGMWLWLKNRKWF
ncbi:MAG: magnesium/cobalt transporter CorA [Blastochloris sp.]|nr:magnesium/cobalt transporter CorA [Blastochloris sp.]